MWGRNVLAAEVHQVNRTSSDLGFDLELEGTSLNVEATPEMARLVELEREIEIPEDLPRLALGGSRQVVCRCQQPKARHGVRCARA